MRELVATQLPLDANTVKLSVVSMGSATLDRFCSEAAALLPMLRMRKSTLKEQADRVEATFFEIRQPVARHDKSTATPAASGISGRRNSFLAPGPHVQQQWPGGRRLLLPTNPDKDDLYMCSKMHTETDLCPFATQCAV